MIKIDQPYVPAKAQVERFVRDLDALVKPDDPIGVAVSGGPDSLALLLLAAAARPGKVKAATVDHGLRENSRDEAEMVAALCAKMGIPHEILTVEWKQKPVTAIPARARLHRYRELAQWARAEGIKALLTAHHQEDQAETLLMRLRRGSGIRGLASMRWKVTVPGSDESLVRPLLGWGREELRTLVTEAGLEPVEDPTNSDPQFERARVRKIVSETDWLDSRVLAQTALNLADADAALRWAAGEAFKRSVTMGDGAVTFDPNGLPREIRRRIVSRLIQRLASEGRGGDLRGRQSDRLLMALSAGKKATIRGVLCEGGDAWRFSKAPTRTAKPKAKAKESA